MEIHLNKPARIHVRVGKADLFFIAQKVTEVTCSHISFVDKYGKDVTFSRDVVVEINS